MEILPIAYWLTGQFTDKPNCS